jgi:hypothetical protein
MTKLVRFVLTLAIAVMLAACSASPAPHSTVGPGQVLDGFPIGAPVDMPAQDETRQLAILALSDREPNHPPIVSIGTYAEDLTNATVFPDQPRTRSGSVTVFVFTFDDGTQAATGVYCGAGPCQPEPTFPH